MSILTRTEILKEISAGNILIEPFHADCVGPASVDLHLGKEFRVFRKVHDVVRVTAESNYEEITERILVEDHLLLMPQETVLGITQERITLSSSLCGWLEGRSRFSRLGLLVHISASFMQPGIANKQVLEISNQSPMPLALYPGIAICQFIFQRTIGEARYEGKFRNQKEGNF
ncbi:MAG TPA: dCTP deaminase [Acidobacteriota bacterium]|nr:dCTP deaminase [Acidobacteriota bacterium]